MGRKKGSLNKNINKNKNIININVNSTTEKRKRGRPSKSNNSKSNNSNSKASSGGGYNRQSVQPIFMPSNIPQQVQPSGDTTAFNSLMTSILERDRSYSKMITPSMLAPQNTINESRVDIPSLNSSMPSMTKNNETPFKPAERLSIIPVLPPTPEQTKGPPPPPPPPPPPKKGPNLNGLTGMAAVIEEIKFASTEEGKLLKKAQKEKEKEEKKAQKAQKEEKKQTETPIKTDPLFISPIEAVNNILGGKSTHKKPTKKQYKAFLEDETTTITPQQKTSLLDFMGGGFKTPAKQTKTPAKQTKTPQAAPPQAAKKEDYRAALENSMATRLQKVIKGHKIRKQINDEADVLEQKLLKTEHNIQASKMIANVKQGSELRK